MTSFLDPTPDSLARMALAESLAQAYPFHLFFEIAVTGSTALGIADATSDLELNFWHSDLPSADERSAWLAPLGMTDRVIHSAPRADGSWWIEGRMEAISVELGWQTVADLNATLEAVMTANTEEHSALVVADLMQHAITIRGGGVLEMWRERLAHYPDVLRRALIAPIIHEWRTDHWLMHPSAEISSGEVRARLRGDLRQMLRVLFALNRRYEPSWKRAPQRLHELGILPKHYIQNHLSCAALVDVAPYQAVILCQQMLREVLALVMSEGTW